MFLRMEQSFHSINIPSEWGYGENTSPLANPIHARFHSINIPSEWGYLATQVWPELSLIVSIQLISPASGDS